MKRIFVLALALGCGDEQPLLVDTSEPFVEEDLDPSCEGIEGSWEASGLDVAAVEGEAVRTLDGQALLIELDGDGTFTSAHLTDDGLAEVAGTWEAEGEGRVRIDPFVAGLAEPVTLTCRPQGDRLALYGTGPYLFEGEASEDAQILLTLERVRGGAAR